MLFHEAVAFDTKRVVTKQNFRKLGNGKLFLSCLAFYMVDVPVFLYHDSKWLVWLKDLAANNVNV